MTTTHYITDEIKQHKTRRKSMCHNRISHIHTRLTAFCPGLLGWAGTRKVKPIWILLKQETVSGGDISWALCKSAPRSRQITTPAPHRSVFYRPPNQQRQSTEGKDQDHNRIVHNKGECYETMHKSSEYCLFEVAVNWRFSLYERTTWQFDKSVLSLLRRLAA